MTPQPAQAHEFDAARLPPDGQGWTAMADGVPVCVGGVLEIWPGRGYVYALLDAHVGPHMLSLTRAIRFLLADLPFARIEMVVEADFTAGRRWAELLGFELETPVALRRFLPSGRDAWIYARINDGMGTVRSAGHGNGRRAV